MKFSSSGFACRELFLVDLLAIIHILIQILTPYTPSHIILIFLSCRHKIISLSKSCRLQSKCHMELCVAVSSESYFQSMLGRCIWSLEQKHYGKRGLLLCCWSSGLQGGGAKGNIQHGLSWGMASWSCAWLRAKVLLIYLKINMKCSIIYQTWTHKHRFEGSFLWKEDWYLTGSIHN